MDKARQNAVQKAIKLAGNQSKLAKMLNITPQALGKQLRNGGLLPKYCIALEQKYPGELSRYDLRPDHFGTGAVSSDCVVIVLQKFHSVSTTI